jgi:hypothetical protein
MWGADGVHTGDLIDDPLLVAGAMVLAAALALFVAVAVAHWLWGRERAAPPDARSPGASGSRARAPLLPAVALRQEWQRLTAHASAAATLAARARAEAAVAREHSAAAEAVRDVAWHEYERIESPPVASRETSPDPGIGATRGTGAAAGAGAGLAHAAFVAFRQGAITVRELQRVWGGTATDPKEKERQRAAARRAARQREARQAYQRAATAARLALEQARIAEVAAEALTSEAAEAEREARAAQALVEQYLRRR